MWEAVGFKYALTWPWNLLNRYPVPLGQAEARVPTGMQVIGQTFTGLDTFQFASNWSHLQPPMFSDERIPNFA